MRNLLNTRHRVLEASSTSLVTACAWDVTTDAIICAYGPTAASPVIELKRWYLSSSDVSQAGSNIIASWDSPPPRPDMDCDTILSLKYFPDSSLISLIFLGGDIVVVRENPMEHEDKIEIVGSVDCGIAAAAWSPDEELLTLATNEDTFLYMSREFDVITSLKFDQEDLKASKHVNVGWGKSETQFKGRGVKALRDPTMPEKVDQGLPSSLENNSTTISWRGDGSFVAVNTVQSSSRRVIRVYSREGALDSVSEPVDFLEGTLSWRPAGNLMAGVQRLDDQIKVIFFERNGLRHGEFPLRLNKSEASDWGSSVKLIWNVDSTVLAAVFRDRVQLWTMGNYHYYLKQEILFNFYAGEQNNPLVWHPEQPLSFGVNTGYVHRLEYVWNVSKGSTISPNDNGTVAVIDGSTLKLTHFRVANVPPPMALHDVLFDQPAVDVAIWDESRDLSNILVLTQTDLLLFHSVPSKAGNDAPVLKMEMPLSDLQLSHERSDGERKPQQVAFLDSKTVQVLLTDTAENVLSLIDMDSEKFIGVKKTTFGLSNIRELLPGLLACPTKHYLAKHNGEVETINKDGQLPIQPLSGPIEHTEIISIRQPANVYQSADEGSDTLHFAVTLTKSGSLYANSRCLAKNCTSFVTTSSHILFTTTQHLLKFVHIDCVQDLEVPPDTPETDERCRSVERGARIVTVIPSRSAVVLQMPRGNLETIYPRALVLAEIRRHINESSFKKAFMYCRNHRVDMNILHDHDPGKFLTNIPLFVDQIKKIEHIDLFLSNLKEEDVSITMYKETLKKKAQINGEQEGLENASNSADQQLSTSKVNRICGKFLEALKPRRETHLQSIITAHCCKSPPDLESGLLEVARLQDHDKAEASRAVEHICFLVDVNRLYDTALGLYNLRLTLLVAQQSQKDPREYFPFLQELRDQPLVRMKFSIDDYLKRRIKALKHLQELDVFEEFKTYVVRHDLYEDALKLYRYRDTNLREIMKLYADHLSGLSKHQQAGLAYEYLQDYSAASEAYRLAHLWQESLSCASLIPMSESQVQELARTISDSLHEEKKYHAAAVIHLDYLKEPESAAKLFCKGYCFTDAIRVVSMQNKPELLETIIDSGLVEGMSAMTELLADCKSQLAAQVPRIRELRAKKAEAASSFLNADTNQDVDIPDNISLAETAASTMGASLFTRYTNRTGTVATNTTRQTSKNKRREERKKARGKKGSAYEEEYLVNSVGRLFERINSVNDETRRLVTGLMRRGMRERAAAVEAAMLSVIEACHSCEEEVFQRPTQQPPIQEIFSVGQDIEKADRDENHDGLETQAQEQQRREPLLPFEKTPFVGN